jgi:DNA adenine methylase
VEVFGGGGAVLFAKGSKSSRLEVYNDVDGGLVNFYRVLRDHGDELQRLLLATPYSRQEWNEARLTWDESDDPIEQARRWFVAVAQAFGGQGFGEGGQTTTGGWGGERLGRMNQSRASTWAHRADRLTSYARRLHRVQIERLDWRECLERYDGPDTCFYLDPPYVPATRRSGGYRHELTMDDHAELVERILALRASVLVSGYDHELYRPLEDAGFERREWETVCSSAARRAGADMRRTEVLWRRVNDDGRLF